MLQGAGTGDRYNLNVVESTERKGGLRVDERGRRIEARHPGPLKTKPHHAASLHTPPSPRPSPPRVPGELSRLLTELSLANAAPLLQ